MNEMVSSVTIRHAEINDSMELLSLMRGLAEFEGYIDQFCVTLTELKDRLFTRRDFNVLVADHQGSIVGMIVYYDLPFTWDLRPWVHIKELYVETEFRSEGVGKKLMVHLSRECSDRGVSKIKWDVLESNHKAKKFYQSLGAHRDTLWETYSLNESDINALSV